MISADHPPGLETMAFAMEKVTFTGKHGEIASREPIPTALEADAKRAREKMIEACADVDDAVAELFLSGAEVPRELLIAALRKAVHMLKQEGEI